MKVRNCTNCTQVFHTLEIRVRRMKTLGKIYYLVDFLSLGKINATFVLQKIKDSWNKAPCIRIRMFWNTFFFFLVYWFSVHKTITKTQLHEKRSPEWKIDFPYWCETGWKRKTFENETPRYLISHGTSTFHCHLLYLNLSVAYLN